jgi:hypothetical protein
MGLKIYKGSRLAPVVLVGLPVIYNSFKFFAPFYMFLFVF